MSSREGREYAIADNRTSELAEWDPVALDAWHQRFVGDPDFHLERAGFVAPELDAILGHVTIPDSVPQTATHCNLFIRSVSSKDAKALADRVNERLAGTPYDCKLY